MQSLTFVIFTFNEENRIETVIENLKNFGKILLADDSSTDRTHEIANSHGCDIYIRERSYEFAENQELVNFLYDRITTDWIYWGFADEMLDLKTLEEIEKVIRSDNHDIISMDRKNYFYGEFCHDLFHARTFKIFKKYAIDFTDNVIHSMGKAVVAEERICNLPDKYFVHHFISNNCFSYLNSINRYTEVDLSGKSYMNNSLFSLFFLIIKHYLKNFLFDKGYKTGFTGIALIELMITYAIIKSLKMHERKFNLTSATIEKKNNIVRGIIKESIYN